MCEWPLVNEFLDRESELDRLERWWASDERMPVNLYGRRRVGKSWLFRRFAHGKPALILASERLAEGSQLTRFADQLAEATDGVPPHLPDVASLIRVLYRVARDSKVLAVIDEFPWLLGSNEVRAEQTLSAIQAVMEQERDNSQLKLILCGSAIGQMEALQSEANPLHGRLIPLEVRPLSFERSYMFMPSLRPVEAFTRFAITGGTPRYLAALGGGGLRDAVADQVLRPDGPLWNEGRTIVGQELREPAVHFSVLELLASGEKQVGEIANALRMDSSRLSSYLDRLVDLRLIRRDLPFGAAPSQRGGHWVLEDAFLRFWFRFVFGYQADLEAGLRPADLYNTEIAPALASHIAPTFERICREHVRATLGRRATRVGRWWGNALDSLRQQRARSTEEIDIVGISRGRVTVVGESKWTAKPLSVAILRDLAEYKLPALTQDGFKLAGNLTTVLYSLSGYTDGLRKRADEDPHLELIDVPEMLAAARPV